MEKIIKKIDHHYTDTTGYSKVADLGDEGYLYVSNIFMSTLEPLKPHISEINLIDLIVRKNTSFNEKGFLKLVKGVSGHEFKAYYDYLRFIYSQQRNGYPEDYILPNNFDTHYYIKQNLLYLTGLKFEIKTSVIDMSIEHSIVVTLRLQENK